MKKQSKHNQISGLEARSEHISTAQTQQIDFERRHENRGLDASTLLATLRIQHPNFYAFAEVVGKWVWIAFPEKQPVSVTSILSELGFHWNTRRQTWQHRAAHLQRGASSLTNAAPTARISPETSCRHSNHRNALRVFHGSAACRKIFHIQHIIP